jgi:hypothetical protein
LGQGQILGTTGVSLFLLSLAFVVFNPVHAIIQEDPALNPSNEPPQPNFGVIVNPGCTDGDTIPANSNGNGDGLCNSWETSTGLRISYGGVTYKYLCGAYGPDTICPSTIRRDTYLEYDWLLGHEPNVQAISNVVNSFTSNQINLHVQKDENTNKHWNLVQVVPMDGSQTPPNTNPEFNEIKRFYFGTPADKLNANYLTAKRQAFHYALFGHQIESDPTLSGLAEMPGNDMFIAMGSFGTPTINQTAGTFMHELGHNLGLNHGGLYTMTGSGIDCKPNYLSVMSFSRMTPDLLDSIGMGNGWALTYSNTQSTLNESSLVEGDPLGLAVGQTIIHGNDAGTAMGVPVTSSGIDWDGNGGPVPSAPSMDANKITAIGCSGSGTTSYTAPNDWSNLSFKFRGSSSGPFGDGVAVGKFKEIFQKYPDKSNAGELIVSKKSDVFRDEPFKNILGNLSFTKSPRAQEKAGIASDDIICAQTHEFIYVNRTKDSTGTPLCIQTNHFGEFLELFKEFVFFDQYLCDINISIGENSINASIIDSYPNSKTGQPLNCSEYVKQYQ